LPFSSLIFGIGFWFAPLSLQLQFAGYEDEYVRLWRAREEDKMGRDCSWLPEGISRTEMMEALGAFGEKEKAEVLESIKRGCYGEKKRRMFGRL